MKRSSAKTISSNRSRRSYTPSNCGPLGGALGSDGSVWVADNLGGAISASWTSGRAERLATANPVPFQHQCKRHVSDLPALRQNGCRCRTSDVMTKVCQWLRSLRSPLMLEIGADSVCLVHFQKRI
jgi:hypothetical protein